MICVQLGGLQSQEIPLLWGKQDSISKIDCLTTSGVLLQKYLKALGGREINGQGWENGKFTIVGDVSVRVLTPCLKREKNKGDRVCEGGLMCYENAAFVKENLQQAMN